MSDKPSARSTRWTVFLTVGVWLYLVGILGVALLIFRLSDVWWLATVFLFAPRWIWALPLVGIVPAALLLRRRKLLWPLAPAALLLLAVNGFELPSLSSLLSDREPADLRVMTYNIGGGKPDPADIVALLDKIAPDVALFQECESPIGAARPALEQKGWHVDVTWGSCIASRYPIIKVDIRDPKDIWEMGGSGVIARYEIRKSGFRVNVVNLHTETVREGLAEVMHRAWRGAPGMEANIRQRDYESGLARAWTERASGPLVITGDFNMPLESAIYRRHWSSFTNAFSEAGFGFGTTKVTKVHGIRIDHVLVGPGWAVLAAWVGPHLGMDHRPMVTDLRWLGEES
jgi:vancomycin resistance protein VanJ